MDIRQSAQNICSNWVSSQIFKEMDLRILFLDWQRNVNIAAVQAPNIMLIYFFLEIRGVLNASISDIFVISGDKIEASNLVERVQWQNDDSKEY